MAGFEVLDIINEPTAAAVAFGFQQGYLNARRQHRRAAAHPGLRPGRRHVRRDRDGDPRHRVHRPGHRRRRPPGRLRLGPAAGRPGGRAVHPPAHARSARRPASRPASCGANAKTPSGRSRPGTRPPWPATIAGCRRADRSHPAAVRGGHAGPAGPHALHHRADAEGGRPGLERHRPRAAGRRLDPHADGPRRCSSNFRARSPTPRWRPTRRWPTARRCTPG